MAYIYDTPSHTFSEYLLIPGYSSAECVPANVSLRISYTPEIKTRNHFQNEIDAFVEDVKTREKLPSSIETVILTQQILQAIYDSSASHAEIKL